MSEWFLSPPTERLVIRVDALVGSLGVRVRRVHTEPDARKAGNKRERRRYAGYAKATSRKDRRLNIRLSSKDLEAIPKRALAEGLPYQMLLSSLLHKYAAGRLKEL